jgi:hypothetical protein
VTDDIDPKDMETDEQPRARDPPGWFSDWTRRDMLLLILLYLLPFLVKAIVG